MQDTVALFLFAHQDDEFGVFEAIRDELNLGRDVHCVYLTDGSYGGVSPQRRELESRRVLSSLGLRAKNIAFDGVELSIADGSLPEKLEVCGRRLRKLIAGSENIESIYVPAWEGGHQDHDALHALVVEICADLGKLSLVRQFSLYNAYHCPGPLFRVFRTLPQNGEVMRQRIPVRNRLRFLRYCLSYPSQVGTWLGLFPQVALAYLVDGHQGLQPVSLERVREKPHTGTLYYERRAFYTWAMMERRLAEWREREFG